MSGLVGKYGCWVVLVLLAGIGLKMISDGLRDAPTDVSDLSRGWKMVTLSIVTSIDALGVGFGFGLLGLPILKPALIIGGICVITTIAGLYLGVRIYDKIGHRGLILGGLILICIGVKMVL